MTKTCTKCGKTKALSEFYKDAIRKDGLRSFCKSCDSERNKDWHSKNKSRVRKRPPKCGLSKLRKLAYLKNPERFAKSHKKWRIKNKSKVNAKNSRYRAIKMDAMPVWLTDIHKAQIQWFYDAAKMMTDTSGILHHVDHVHPLQGKNFRGLHVPWNLQILPASENSAKCNKLITE